MKAKICTYEQKMFSKYMNRRSAIDCSFGTLRYVQISFQEIPKPSLSEIHEII